MTDRIMAIDDQSSYLLHANLVGKQSLPHESVSRILPARQDFQPFERKMPSSPQLKSPWWLRYPFFQQDQVQHVVFGPNFRHLFWRFNYITGFVTAYLITIEHKIILCWRIFRLAQNDTDRRTERDAGLKINEIF